MKSVKLRGEEGGEIGTHVSEENQGPCKDEEAHA
jgi:hypothetical protein